MVTPLIVLIESLNITYRSLDWKNLFEAVQAKLMFLGAAKKVNGVKNGDQTDTRVSENGWISNGKTRFVCENRKASIQQSWNFQKTSDIKSGVLKGHIVIDPEVLESVMLVSEHFGGAH